MEKWKENILLYEAYNIHAHYVLSEICFISIFPNVIKQLAVGMYFDMGDLMHPY